MSNLEQIAAHIGEASGQPFALSDHQAIGGGCINDTIRLSDGERRYFVKLNSAARLDMFAAEQAGLEALLGSHSIRVPQPLCHGIAGHQAYLVMEFIQLGRAEPPSAQLAGQQLADMHQHRQARFGWHRDNTIGATPQLNEPHTDWVEFWRHQRLGFQLELAAKKGYGGQLQRQGEKLLAQLPALIDHNPIPSLLHGDLWGGNLAYDREGNPVIYDPAVYYGDRETDIAMTELFGGFGSSFYAAYQDAWPLDPGYSTRKNLYNLYHILNHLNLFGGGYLGQAQSMIATLLAECG